MQSDSREQILFRSLSTYELKATSDSWKRSSDSELNNPKTRTKEGSKFKFDYDIFIYLFFILILHKVFNIFSGITKLN